MMVYGMQVDEWLKCRGAEIQRIKPLYVETLHIKTKSAVGTLL
jgi:hypothetical protein